MYPYYILEVFRGGVWVRPFKGRSSFPTNLEARAEKLKKDGSIREDEQYRVWDLKKEEVYVAPVPVVYSAEELAERERVQAERQEAYRLVNEEYNRERQAHLASELAKYEAEVAKATANLEGKSLVSVEDFAGLTDMERKLIGDKIYDGYNAFNVDDDYGFDMEVFVKVLLQQGWKLPVVL